MAGHAFALVAALGCAGGDLDYERLHAHLAMTEELLRQARRALQEAEERDPLVSPPRGGDI